MRLRRFELAVAAQVLSILVVCAAIGWVATTTDYYATLLILAAVLALLVASLLLTVRRTNRDLSRFLLAVRHSDFSQSFSAAGRGGYFPELAAAFEEVLRRFRDARGAEEEQASYLQTIVQHVPVAVVAWDQTGRIDLFNRAARNLFGVATLRNLGDYDGLGRNFPEALAAIEPGEPRLLKVMKDGELLQLSATAARLRIRDRSLTIMTLQDIHGELEARELTAWQNLIRILTHEIMNSVTPISSLAATASELLVEAAHAAAGSAIDDARQAVETIGARSDGLLRFVESYRRLTRLPTPVLQRVKVVELFGRVEQLMRPDLERRGVSLAHAVAPQRLELDADPDLLEQVLINLIRNAVDAVTEAEKPAVCLRGEIHSNGRVTLVVADNGHGMDEEVRETIFVPFFTTKRHGTGIGLSIVRQIMRSHGGTVSVRSTPGEGTEFRLTF